MTENARRFLSGFLTGASVVVLAVPAWGAGDLIVEGEDYALYGSHDLGGIPIGTVFCPAASGYYAASGLDVPGEWILLSVNIPSGGCYSSTLVYQTGYGDEVNLRVRMIDAPAPDDEILVDYWLTAGWGFG